MSADIIIMTTIIIYLMLVIVTGVLIARRTKSSSEGFYLGGRGMGPLVTAMSAEASDMSSYLLMGIPGLAYLSGLADATWTAIGLGVGTYLNFLLVAKRLRRYSEKLNAITIPDFFSKRFGEKKNVIEFVSALIIIIFFIPYVASGLSAIGKLFETLFQWKYMYGVLIGSFVILSYSTLGGFGSVAVMDLIQSIIMTFALAVVVFFAINKAGGFGNAIEYAKSLPGYLSLMNTHIAQTGTSSEYSIITIISTLAWGLGYFGMPHILVRFMSIRKESELSMSRRIASIWVFISMGVAILIGVIGLGMSHVSAFATVDYNGILDNGFLRGSDTEKIIIFIANLLSKVGPLAAIVAGIILAGILAATMSTADSQLLCAASSFSENLLQHTILKKKLKETDALIAARITVAVMIIIAIFFAMNPNSKIFDVVSFAWAGFGACFGPTMLLALFSKRTNATGVMVGMICGAITIFVWKFAIRPIGGAFNIYELLPAFIINLLVTLIVSYITKAPGKDIVNVYEKVMRDI